MANERTHEEAREHLKASLGVKLGETFHQLQTDLVWLHIKWEQYRELYGTKPSRVALLNEAAPLFFRIIEDTLWDDTLLSITRLTDSAGSGSKRRLSVHQLPPIIADGMLKKQVKALIEIAVKKAAFARDWRNRRIAHRDLSHALEPEVTPLVGASRAGVEEALEALRNVLNAIDQGLRGSTFLYDDTRQVHGAESMLYILRDGVDAKRAHLAAMRDGTLPPAEWGPPHAV